MNPHYLQKHWKTQISKNKVSCNFFVLILLWISCRLFFILYTHRHKHIYLNGSYHKKYQLTNNSFTMHWALTTCQTLWFSHLILPATLCLSSAVPKLIYTLDSPGGLPKSWVLHPVPMDFDLIKLNEAWAWQRFKRSPGDTNGHVQVGNY